MVENLPANAGDIRDAGLIPGLGRSHVCRRTWQPTLVFQPGESPWWATVHGVSKSQTQLKRLSTHSAFLQMGKLAASNSLELNLSLEIQPRRWSLSNDQLTQGSKSRITLRSHAAHPLGLAEASLWFIFFLYPVLLLLFPYTCCS